MLPQPATQQASQLGRTAERLRLAAIQLQPQPSLPGNSHTVHEGRQLASDVRHIAASRSASAAIKSDGSVVTWGDADFGGNCDAVKDQLEC